MGERFIYKIYLLFIPQEQDVFIDRIRGSLDLHLSTLIPADEDDERYIRRMQCIR